MWNISNTEKGGKYRTVYAPFQLKKREREEVYKYTHTHTPPIEDAQESNKINHMLVEG